MTIRHVYIVLLLPKGKSREIIMNKKKKKKKYWLPLLIMNQWKTKSKHSHTNFAWHCICRDWAIFSIYPLSFILNLAIICNLSSWIGNRKSKNSDNVFQNTFSNIVMLNPRRKANGRRSGSYSADIRTTRCVFRAAPCSAHLKFSIIWLPDMCSAFVTVDNWFRSPPR